MRTLAFCFFAFFAATQSNSAHANVGDAFGFGPRAMALSGAAAALGNDVASVYHNPAGLGLHDGSEERFRFTYSLVFISPSFKSISNVVTQNTYVADARVVSDVDLNYKSTFGQELGFTYRVLPEIGNFTVGVVSFLPFSQFAFMDSGEAFVPEYVLYRARTQRPQVELGVGIDAGKGFHFGAGVHTAFSLTGNASVFLNTQPNTISSMRFISSLKPKVAPYIGILYNKDEGKGLSLASVFRFAATSDNTIMLNSAARAFGNVAAVDFNFTATSALFYDPAALEIGGAIPIGRTRAFAQVEYQLWKDFQPPALLIAQPTTTNCNGVPCSTLQISAGAVPGFAYRNIWVVKAGHEFPMGENLTLRWGYAYRPSMMDGTPNEAGNFLDPAKHVFNIGAGLNIPKFIATSSARLDFNVGYQYLVPFRVTKSSGNEVGVSSDEKIGAPGYDVGGNLIGGGLALAVSL